MESSGTVFSPVTGPFCETETVKSNQRNAQLPRHHITLVISSVEITTCMYLGIVFWCLIAFEAIRNVHFSEWIDAILVLLFCY